MLAAGLFRDHGRSSSCLVAVVSWGSNRVHIQSASEGPAHIGEIIYVNKLLLKVRFEQSNVYSEWVNLENVQGTHLAVVPCFNEREMSFVPPALSSAGDPLTGDLPLALWRQLYGVALRPIEDIQPSTPVYNMAIPEAMPRAAVFDDTNLEGNMIGGDIYVRGWAGSGR